MNKDALAPQIAAADPGRSVWVSANAGSGKTRVLTDRVARLLLRGVSPQNILCLTYTKAAAAEMQNRLFERLGEWSMAPDAALAADLASLGEGAGGADDLARARRLFARAIETPGGLRIQTIHSFCAAILRRFPMEAGVSPGFAELDERSAAALRAEVLEAMADQPDTAHILRRLASEARQGDLTALAAEIAAHADRYLPPRSDADLAAALNHDPRLDEAAIAARVFLGHEAALFAKVIPVLTGKGANDTRLAEALSALAGAPHGPGALPVLEAAFLTKDGRIRAKQPTKASRDALGPDAEVLDALMQRVEAARARRLALQGWRYTCLFHAFARAFLADYARRKSERGWLDFDDLITRADALLNDRAMAAWVLFRLDGGIDHILVDEAQDTSPRQWSVIRALTEEFTAGQGARAVERSLFIVGDKKQSIYSFQGADVAGFDRVRGRFAEAFAGARLAFQSTELEYSFRSSQAVLGLVDATFSSALVAEDGRALFQGTRHAAFFGDLPGRADLWPLIEPVKPEAEETSWDDPVDRIGAKHHFTELAEKIADFIARALSDGTMIPTRDGPRPLSAGDILILVQRRSRLFTAVIRACKERGIPIAGADRMQILDEIAVRDLVALMAFLATPEDDLSLAAALRSPLLGLSEDDLFRLAHGRRGYLWEALRGARHRHPAQMAMLDDLRDAADYLRPYELAERILTRHGGRARLLARLGRECEDGLDEFLTQALAYEGFEPPSLAGFLVWLTGARVEVKRQAEAGGGLLRVMTVHGAKGLEAPLVILADTADATGRNGTDPPEDEEGTALWGPETEAVAAARQRSKEARAEESLRLLYVAMTRARTWLVVAGAGKAKLETVEGPRPMRHWCWHALVSAGFDALGVPVGAAGERSTCFGIWPAPQGAALPLAAEDHPAPPPDWLTSPAPPALRPAQALSPSALGGAKALIGEEAEGPGGASRGSAIHLLLEHLPGLDPARAALRAEALIPDPALRAEALAEVQPLLSDPRLAHLFAPGTLAEIALTAPLPGGGVLTGMIDRLVLTPDGGVLAVDFKSNRLVPDRPEAVPEGILRQLGAYQAALEAIYPARAVRVAVLWTRTGDLMPIDPKIVRSAFARAPSLDVPGGNT